MRAVPFVLLLLLAGCSTPPPEQHAPVLQVDWLDGDLRPLKSPLYLTQWADGHQEKSTVVLEVVAHDLDGDVAYLGMSTGPRPGHMDLRSRADGNTTTFHPHIEGPHPSIRVDAHDRAGNSVTTGTRQFEWDVNVQHSVTLNATAVEQQPVRCEGLVPGSVQVVASFAVFEPARLDAEVDAGNADIAICKNGVVAAYGSDLHSVPLNKDEPVEVAVFLRALVPQTVELWTHVHYDRIPE